MLNYKITAYSNPSGNAEAMANKTILPFDASDGRDEIRPNPAELLLTALAACMLKNIERYSIKLKIPYDKANIEVDGTRGDVPPAMEEITYKVSLTTRATDRQVDLLHRNVVKYGTISNTLAKACKVSGTFAKF